MRNENLIAYLNDHLAGSVAALELIDHLIETPDTLADEPFLRELRGEIDADQTVLREVLTRFGGEESTTRKAAAWLMEKVGWAKLHLADATAGGMGRLQAFEGLVLGITGKAALWRALAETHGSAIGVDIVELTRRAEDQRDRVEAHRLQAARAAFADA